MKHHFLFSLLVFWGSLSPWFGVEAQTIEDSLQWCLITDRQEAIALSEVQYMVQKDGTVEFFDIVLHNGELLPDVHTITFEQRNLTALGTLHKDAERPRIFQVANNLTLSQLPQNSTVRVADMSGRTWLQAQADAQGIAHLSVEHFPQGAYLLIAGKTSIKFLKN